MSLDKYLEGLVKQAEAERKEQERFDDLSIDDLLEVAGIKTASALPPSFKKNKAKVVAAQDPTKPGAEKPNLKKSAGVGSLAQRYMAGLSPGNIAKTVAPGAVMGGLTGAGTGALTAEEGQRGRAALLGAGLGALGGAAGSYAGGLGGLAAGARIPSTNIAALGGMLGGYGGGALAGGAGGGLLAGKTIGKKQAPEVKKQQTKVEAAQDPDKPGAETASGKSLKKVAKIWGADAPDPWTLGHAGLPYEHRRKLMEQYADLKSQEEPTGLGTALGVGGGIGAGMGGLMGAGLGASRSLGAGKGALLGAALGGLTGAGLGALARSEDIDAIAKTKGMVEDPSRIDPEIASMVGADLGAERRTAERRHQQTLAALRKTGAAGVDPGLIRGAETASGKSLNKAAAGIDPGMTRGIEGATHAITDPAIVEDVRKRLRSGTLKGLGVGAGVGAGAGGLAGGGIGLAGAPKGGGLKGKLLSALIGAGAGAGLGALPGGLIGSGVGQENALRNVLREQGIDRSGIFLPTHKFNPEAAAKHLGYTATEPEKTSAPIELNKAELQEALQGAQDREDIAGRSKRWGIGGAALGGAGGGLAGGGLGYLGARAAGLGGLGRVLATGAGALPGAFGGGALGARIGRTEGAEEAAADLLVSKLRQRAAGQRGAMAGYLAGMNRGIGMGGPQPFPEPQHPVKQGSAVPFGKGR